MCPNMENLLILGVPILKHITVIFFNILGGEIRQSYGGPEGTSSDHGCQRLAHQTAMVSWEDKQV